MAEPVALRPSLKRNSLLKLIQMLLLVIVGFFVLVVLLLMGCQRSLIYFPQPYGMALDRVLAHHVEQLDYRIDAGDQTAFYVAPRENPDAPPERLWVLTAGNASLALDWLDLVSRCPDPHAGFLLVDYPGYGVNAGGPSRESIRQGTLAAFLACTTRLGVAPDELEGRICLIGHSLGAAAALELAAQLDPPPARIILISPFSSMAAMARRAVGWPLCLLLRDRFDNEARLAELLDRPAAPAITIIHGDQDPVIPVEMSRSLAARFGDQVEYIEIPFGDHNWILQSAESQILERMESPPVEERSGQ